jgi:transposase
MDMMSTKGQTTTLEERIIIAERTRAGVSSRQIAAELGRPVATVRKWRQRYNRGGRVGLSSQMGRPATGALAQSPAEMKKAILEMREKQPGWGAITLRLELAKDKRFEGQKLPSRARLAAYLKE